jgi:aldose sugar dehydrogenase
LSLSTDGLQITGTSTWFQNWFGRLRDVCVSPDGRVFLAVSNRDGRGSPKPIDDRIIQIKASGTLNQEKIGAVEKMKIYPNPMLSHSIIKLNNESNESGELMIYDLAGNLIFRDVFPGNEYFLNRTNFNPGYYLIRVSKGSLIMDSYLIIL